MARMSEPGGFFAVLDQYGGSTFDACTACGSFFLLADSPFVSAFC